MQTWSPCLYSKNQKNVDEKSQLLYRSTMQPVPQKYNSTVSSTIMNKLIALPVALGLAISAHALPMYE